VDNFGTFTKLSNAYEQNNKRYKQQHKKLGCLTETACLTEFEKGKAPGAWHDGKIYISAVS